MGLHSCFWPLSIALAALGCTTSSEVGGFNEAGAPDASTEAEDASSIELEPALNRLALGSASSCAIDSSGAVVCWGSNYVGQLGIGDFVPESSSTPLKVGALPSPARAVFGGTAAHCVVLDDGHVECWGDAVFGELEGRGAVHAIALSPFETPGLSSVASMAIGTYFHCALNTEGGAKCYGLNGAGQLGIGSLQDSFAPAGVLGLGPSRVLAASQAGFFACAATAEGQALCWGSNTKGQLGNGSTKDALSPEPVTGLESGVTALAAGRDHACAVAAGMTYCWGDNSEAQLGNGGGVAYEMPLAVGGMPPLVALAAGAAHTCGLSDAGAVYCWGSSASGSSPFPTQVVAAGVVELAAGGHHSCALSGDGTLRCWGYGSSGELGPFGGAGAPL